VFSTTRSRLPLAGLLLLMLLMPLVPFVPTPPAQAQEFDPYPLRPPDTSSPRATFRSFITEMNQAVQIYRNDEHFASRKDWDQALNHHVSRALRTMDLSEVPPTFRREIGVETAVQLMEVFDRIQIPEYADIPGTVKEDLKLKENLPEAGAEDEAKTNDEGTVESEGGEAFDAETPPPDLDAVDVASWTVPDTEITIAQVAEGPRKGAFLFTKETVARAEEFYDRVAVLTPRPEATYSAYEIYRSAAGSWFDPDWIAALPGWMGEIFVDNPVWRWIAVAALTVIAVIMIGFAAVWAIARDTAQNDTGARSRSGRLALAVASLLVLRGLEYLISKQFTLVGAPLVITTTILHFLQAAVLIWGTWLLLDQLAQWVVGLRGLRQRSIDAHMIRVSFKIVTFVVILFVIIKVAEQLGIPLTPVLAGLGVGGLAVALAARPTLENVISGMILFADRPVRVGDFFRWGDQVGTVEEIGLRSTRVRTLDRTIVTIPNADFVQMQLDNFQVRDMILWMTKLELRRDTTPDQLQYVLAKMREMLIAHPKVSPDPARVRLLGLSENGLLLDVFVYIKTPDINEWHAVIEDILFRMMRILEEAGTGFSLPFKLEAPPSFGMDPDRARAAEAEVETWRENGKFPFPEFAPDDVKKLAGTLVYPPEGSPDYAPPRLSKPKDNAS